VSSQTTTRATSPGQGSGGRPAAQGRLKAQVPGLARLDSPLTTYYALLGATLLLLVIGLVMVLSASSVTSYKLTGSSFTVFKSQLVFAVAGVIPMFLASRTPIRVWQRFAWPGILLAIVLQSLVFSPLGVSVYGNRNWIAFAGQRLQPSEAAKIALVVWAATVLSRKRSSLTTWSHVMVPVILPVGIVVVGLVLAGRDLGTGLVLLLVLAALLFSAGAPARIFLGAAGVMTALAVLLAATSANRMARIEAWLKGSCPDQLNTCFQSIHGKYALADGGWWGVGLGASREKWSWLPEAHNDFIFAIIGEELGLVGALVVLALFAVLAWACYRLVVRSDDAFVRIATAGVMAWLIGQALINIGAVIGMLPVIGVPLPLVSSGGTALLTTMFALGMLLSFARQEPDCRAALSGRPSLLRRSLVVVPGLRGRMEPARVPSTRVGGR
jgi:cell division protein FtsW